MASNPKSSADTATKANKSSATSSPPTNPVVLELIYQRLISSVSIDVTCHLHRMIKTGIYPASELLVPKSRSEIYPEVYSNKEENAAEKDVKRYSVAVPKRTKRKRAGEKEETAYEKYIRTSTAKQPDTAISNPTPPVPTPPPHYFDIWGKTPPKEPRDMVDCLICGRQVNTLRFAQHLDKCMLGSSGSFSRAANNNSSGVGNTKY